MKLKKIFLLFIIFAPFLLLAGDSLPLVPCAGPNCHFCSLLHLAERIKNFLIFTIGIPVASLMFIYAGFLYLSAKPTNINSAHKIFKNAVLGLIIMLISYLVVDLILTTLANNEINNFWKTGLNC